MKKFYWLGAILVIAALIGFGWMARKGGHESYDARYFPPGPTLGLVKALSDDALEGRETGTPASAIAQTMIDERMAQIGLEPRAPGVGYAMPFRYGPIDAAERPVGTNLIGVIRGRGPSASARIIVVTAHYDHIGIRDGEIFNGADDNASGVGALLAMARYFNRRPPQHDIWFVITDAEEKGLGGAVALLEAPPFDIRAVALNINLDMVSRSAEGELYAVGTYHRPFLIPLVEAIAAQAPVTLLMGHDRPEDGAGDWTLLSDHGVFHLRAIAFIYLGVEDHEDYHKPTDDFARIDQDFYLAAIDTAIMLAVAADQKLDVIAESLAPDMTGFSVED